MHLLMLYRFGNRYSFATGAISVSHSGAKVTQAEPATRNSLVEMKEDAKLLDPPI